MKKCKQLDKCGGYLHGITCTFMNHDKECNIIPKPKHPKSIELKALEIAVKELANIPKCVISKNMDCPLVPLSDTDLECGDVKCLKAITAHFLALARGAK